MTRLALAICEIQTPKIGNYVTTPYWHLPNRRPWLWLVWNERARCVSRGGVDLRLRWGPGAPSQTLGGPPRGRRYNQLQYRSLLVTIRQGRHFYCVRRAKSPPPRLDPKDTDSASCVLYYVPLIWTPDTDRGRGNMDEKKPTRFITSLQKLHIYLS